MYDALGRPIVVERVTNNLTAVGEISSTDTIEWRVRFTSPSGQVLQENEVSNPTLMAWEYVWSADSANRMVCRDDGAPEDRRFAVYDARGNVTAIIRSSGGVVERYVYDPLGNLQVLHFDWTAFGYEPSLDSRWRYLYQGNRYDPTLRVYTRPDGRAYDPVHGLAVASGSMDAGQERGLYTEDYNWGGMAVIGGSFVAAVGVVFAGATFGQSLWLTVAAGSIIAAGGFGVSSGSALAYQQGTMSYDESRLGQAIGNTVMAAGLAYAAAPLASGAVGFTSGIAGGTVAGLSGSAAAGAITSQAVTVGIGVGLGAWGVADITRQLDERGSMDWIDAAGMIAPRVAAVLGGWAARPVATRAFWWGLAKGYGGGTRLGGTIAGPEFQGHHSDPVFMGGDASQPRTRVPLNLHQGQFHKDMNAFLRTQVDAAGNDMSPRRGNAGALIRANFSRSQRLEALGNFYREYRWNYADSAFDFFCRHP